MRFFKCKFFFHLAIILIWFLASNSFGNNTYKFQEIPYVESNVRKSIHHVLKDSRGFIWLGSDLGFAKFNGYEVEFNENKKLNSKLIFQVFEDREKKIWLASFNGLGNYDPTSDSVRLIKFDNLEFPSLNKDFVIRIDQDKKGNLWLATYGGGLVKYDAKTGKSTNYKDNIKTSVVNDQQYLCLMVLDNEKILVSTDNYGILLFDPKSGIFSNITPTIKRNAGGFIKSRTMYKDKKGIVWVGSDNYGIVKYDPQNEKFTYFHDFEKIRKNHIFNITWICEDNKDSTKLLCSSTNGLIVFDKLTGAYECIKILNTGDESYSASNILYSVTVDDVGTIWMGGRKGFYRIERIPKVIKTYFSNNYIAEHGNIVGTIIDIYGCKLFPAAEGFFSYDTLTKKTTKINQIDAKGVTRNFSNVYSSLKDNHNDVWVGALFGLYKYIPHKKVFREVRIKNLSQKLEIWNMTQFKNNNLWLCTGNIGLILLDRTTETKILHLYHDLKDSSSLIDNSVGQIVEYDNQIWVGTFKGLQILDPNTFKSVRKFFAGDGSGLVNSTIIKLYVSKAGHLWIGTPTGLQKYNKNTKKFESALLPNNDNKISDIMEDQDGVIYVNTFNSIFIYNTTTSSFVNLTHAEEIVTNFNDGDAYIDENGLMFFSSVDAVYSLNPKNVSLFKLKPVIYISGFQLFNKEVKPSKEGPFDEPISVEKEIHLKYWQNYFSLEFLLMSLHKDQDNEYAYILEGFDHDWNFIGKKREAIYTNLLPGNYTFKVKAADALGNWTEPVELKIFIHPAFWQTWWFRILVVGISIVLIVLYFDYRTRSIKKKNIILERMVRERTAEISKQKTQINELYKEVTDNIRTAKLIQESILPKREDFKHHFKDSFVFYIPKDIVSGDFYWMRVKNEKIYLAAVDCTGHGVAGAFMSIIGFQLLNNVLADHDGQDAGVFLNMLSERLIKTLQQDSENYISRDGMDISVCIIDIGNRSLHYAGAGNPLYILRQNQIEVVKGDKMSIGLQHNGKHVSFTDNTVEILSGDKFYIFSDGFAGQLGGNNGDQKFMYTRLREMILSMHTRTMDDQLGVTNQTFLDWKTTNEQTDDVMLIGFEV